ncbi:MAG: FKBP-type peptidyl-prolyl cis-trans isomerase [Salinimicrobium sp.]
MKLRKFSLACLLFTAVFVSCNKDDDNPDPDPVEVRDRAVQEVADQEALLEYLQTHFYNYEDFENPSEGFDYSIQLDTIDEANADKTPLIDSDLLQTKTYTFQDVEYKIYILKVREGEKSQPKFTDSTFVSYRGELLDQSMFDSSDNPMWFDLVRTIPGFGQTMTEFKGASGFQVNSDNTVTFNNDYGVGAMFVPSGLAYFQNAPSGIPPYSPLVFTFKLYGVNEADHDGDGIPSYMEDLNNNKIISDDNTDDDMFANYLDPDDDGDFIPTREEIIINEDGTLEFPDKDNDGTPDYLDPDN